MVRGAPYAPLGDEKIETMMKLLTINKGQKAVDLGAGDGRLVIELAKRGIEAHGYEINPVLALWGKWNIRKAGLSGKASMHLGDFWKVDLSKFDIVTIYLTSHIMRQVEKKITKESKTGTQVVVNYFKLPTFKPIKENGKIYLYKITSNN
jgi:cyclopropane fatty-acyl-phospholipid synthase-like methyltransferase